MAVIGHWCVAFLLARAQPGVSVVLFMKLTMLSDTLLLVFSLLGLEVGGFMWPDWMAPPDETLAAVRIWKSTGRWIEGVDPDPEDPSFHGFQSLPPGYIDASYSHSIVLTAVWGIIAAAAWLVLVPRRPDSWTIALGLVAATASHPILDVFFHAAYILPGNRAVTRVVLFGGLWQSRLLSLISLPIDISLAYVPYRIWLAARTPIDDSPNTLDAIRQYKLAFWGLALGLNMTTWYLVELAMYLLWPLGYHLGVLGASDVAIIWLWAIALYPMYKLERHLKLKSPPRQHEKYIHDAHGSESLL